MGSGRSHAVPEGSNERSLWIAFVLTSTYLAAEVVGGIVTGSLALLSDAAHMLTDTAALAIALAAIRIGRRLADSRRTFGYQRLEILAAAFNAVLLFLVALYIIYEAYRRLLNPSEIQSLGMLVIATIGLIVNLVSMRFLAAGKDSSLNLKGAYLEVWSDLLGSIGVIVGALLIQATGWFWIDSLIAVGIGLWVLPRAWTLLSDSLNILLEGVPRGIDLNAVAAAMTGVPGVRDIHDLHVWAITDGETSMTAHVIIAPGIDGETEINPPMRRILAERFDIRHTTLQYEREPCADADGAHRFL